MEVFMHDKNDLSKNVLKYLLLLIPLYLYGIYKNGLILYAKDLIPFFSIFKLIYLLLLGIMALVIVKLIFKKKIKLDLDLLMIFILPLFMPYKINYLVFCGVILLCLIFFFIIDKYFNINKIAFVKLVIMSVCLFKTNLYLNPAEESKLYAFNIFDLICGRSIGGLGSTSILIGLIIMLVLSLKNNYKYLISISAIISYVLLALVLSYDLIFIGSNILALIMVASYLDTSPVEKKYQIIYGILIGVVGVILTKYLNIYEGVFISILIFSIIYEIICKLHKKVL